MSTQWKEEFDKKFYLKDRVWISRGGESYDSITPEMGRGELLRFISQTLQALATEMMEGVGIKDGKYCEKCCERCFITEELDIPVCVNPIECLCHNKEIRKVFKAVAKKWGVV